MNNNGPTQEYVKEKSQLWHSLKSEVSKAIVGQKNIVDKIILAMLCNGHVIIEGVPGLAKTTIIN